MQRLTNQVSKKQWKKMKVMALQMADAVAILQPSARFDVMNHAPMLPRCATYIIDLFPKEIHAGSVPNGKYKYKAVTDR